MSISPTIFSAYGFIFLELLTIVLTGTDYTEFDTCIHTQSTNTDENMHNQGRPQEIFQGGGCKVILTD